MRAGKWTVQQAAELSVPAPTIEAALDGRFLSGLKDERVKAAKIFEDLGLKAPTQHKVPPSCMLHGSLVQVGCRLSGRLSPEESTTMHCTVYICAEIGLLGMLRAAHGFAFLQA
jgi:hypothetical protein